MVIIKPVNYEGMAYDGIIKPEHYANKSIEPIEYIESTMPPLAYLGYLWGNVLKYISRWKDKGGAEDLKKANVYLQWMLEWAEKENQVTNV